MTETLENQVLRQLPGLLHLAAEHEQESFFIGDEHAVDTVLESARFTSSTAWTSWSAPRAFGPTILPAVE
ncbi:MAG: hypothetical protein R2855_09985 [Thermomicrobiales bacterium]